MRRRLFVTAALGAVLAPALAGAQTVATPATPAAPRPQPIEPTNALEYAFVSALTNEGMRPIFRRYLLETHVVLALASNAPDAAPREVQVRDGFRAGAIFTSAARADSVLGPTSARVVINGRAALERLAGKNVVINPTLVPMLTLEPEDVAQYLATPGETSAGPTQ